MLGKDYAAQDCSLARTLEVVGERWTMLIVRDAFYGVQRFSDFQAHLDIPRAILSSRLAGLVADGILTRTPDPAHASRVCYELTPAGRDLWPVVHALIAWGGRHRSPNSRLFECEPCGTPLAADGRCPTCGLVPAPERIITRPAPGRKRRRRDPVAVALGEPHRLLDPLDV